MTCSKSIINNNLLKILVLTIWFLSISCHYSPFKNTIQSSIFTNHSKTILEDNILKNIVDKGVLTVGIEHNHIDYFAFNGKVMGLNYEIIKDYADYLDVTVVYKLINNLDEGKRQLKNREIDLLAKNMESSKEMNGFTLTNTVLTDDLVIVANRKTNVNDFSQFKKLIIPTTLYTIYQRYDDLAALLHTEVRLKETSEYNIIDSVKHNKELCTIVRKSQLDAYKRTEKVDFSEQLLVKGEPFSWLVGKHATIFQNNFNKWITTYKKTDDYAYLEFKYLSEYCYLSTRYDDRTFSINKGMSRYDNLIKSYCKSTKWDWRLVAALIYHESRFDNEAVSPVGATGLMQLMPLTAQEQGIDSFHFAQENIKAGINYLNELSTYWKDIPLKEEQLKFIIASYNAGPGHIIDAVNLAKKYGGNDEVWSNHVDKYIKLKTQPKYYNDEVVKCGQCRGYETYDYVNNIFETYNQYLSLYNS